MQDFGLVRYVMKKNALLKKIAALFIATAVIFGIGTTSILRADEDPSVPELIESGSGYSSILYDNSNGLPTSEANALAMTSEGFIWIGSYSGLIRFDGKNFERIDSTTGITSVNTLFVDSQDRLWVGTNDNGVAMIHKDDIKLLKKADGLHSASVRSILETPDGDIIVATTSGISVVSSTFSVKRLSDPRINDKFIREIKIDKDGIIYALTLDDCILPIKNNLITGTYKGASLGVEKMLSITPDPDDPSMLYVGTEGSEIIHGSLKDEFKTATRIDTSPLTHINDINFIDGQIWICADNGIGYIENGKIKTVTSQPLTSTVLQSMEDYEGNLWFASSHQGVMKIVPNMFQDVFEKYDIPDAVVNTTCLSGNDLYVGTDSGLTVISNGEILKEMPLESAVGPTGEKLEDPDLIKLLKETRIRSIIKDSKDNVWISTYSDYGLIRLGGNSITLFTTDSCLPSNRIRTILERKDGSYLIACRGGVAILKNDKIEKVYNEKSGIANSEILTVAEADNGDILAGSDGGGLYIIPSDGSEIRNIDTSMGLMSDIVMRIKKDPKRDLFWIVTSNSIAFMDTDYNVTTINLFPYSNNFDLYENDKGQMWVISSNGIYVTETEQLLANEQIDTVFYNKENGLQIAATSNAYSELTSDGDLYIAGSTGVSKVNINHPSQSITDVKLAIPYVTADGKNYYPDENGKIKLPSEATRLTIHAFVCTYSLSDPIVNYKLSGIDKETQTTRRSSFEPVTYTGLRGGHYTFEMMITDNFGNESNTISITIIKEKAIYERLWFMILIIVLLVAFIMFIAYLIVKSKTKKLRQKEAEDRLFIREMTEAFAKTIDMKDRYTKGHSIRVAKYTSMLCKELGMDDDTIEKYYNIALLHDIGKIGVPPEVLNKPGKLTDEEFVVIKSHSGLGFNALKDISIMPELATGARSHHERPDGKGYPQGLKGDEIPRVAQIIAVADTFDAMYSDRPYRSRMNFDKAVSIIKEVSGTQLTEDVVDAFLRLVEKGEFRDPDDVGGGSMDDINNIHKKYEAESKNSAPEDKTKDPKDPEDKKEDKE